MTISTISRSSTLHMMLAAAMLTGLAATATAQITFTLTGTDATRYPNISVFFDAKDRNNVPIRSYVPSDFTVMENGVPRPVVSVSCPAGVTPPISVTLLIDVSWSMGVSNRMTNAQVAARKFVRSIAFPPARFGIVTFDLDTKAYLPHTSDTTAIINAINALKVNSSGGTDYYGAFVDAVTGGLDFTRNQPGAKYLIFMSDGADNLTPGMESQIIMGANGAGIKIYTVLLTPQLRNDQLRRIATGTGGQWFEDVTTEAKASDVFTQIANYTYQYDPCELVYLTTGCDPVRNVDITLRKNASSATRSTTITVPASAVVTLDASSVLVEYGVVPQGTNKTSDVTLTARYGPVTVQSITSPLPSFTVQSYGGSAPPFTLAQNESRTIRINYYAVDLHRTSTVLNVQTTAPCQKQVVLAAGSLDAEPLKLVQPNGGERWYSGTSNQIRWTGVPPTQGVALEYSTDAGVTWRTISLNAYSLFTPWSVPNTPSDSCLGLVRTTDQRNSARDAMWMPMQNAEIVNLALAPTGTLLAVALNDGRIKMYYPGTGELVTILPGHTGTTHSLAFSPDQATLASGGGDGLVKIWETATGNLLRTLSGHSALVHSVAYSRDGRYLVSADQTGLIAWKTSDWSQLWAKSGNTFADGAIALDPRNNWIASASGNKIDILNFSTGAFIRGLSAHTAPIRALSSSSDGLVLASGSEDRTVRIWSTTAWKISQTISGHTGTVTSVNLSPAGLNVISSSRDRSVRVWDARTATMKQTFTQHTADVLAARFDYRTGLIASGGNDRTVRVWGYSVPLADLSDSLWAIITPSTTLQASTPTFPSLLCPGEYSEDFVHLKNAGNQPITITGSAITGSGAQVFSLAGMTIPPAIRLNPEDTVSLPIRFAATTPGDFQATLELQTDASSIPRLDIPLFGHKDSASVSIFPDTLDAGEVYACTLPARLPFVLHNPGTVDATVDSVSASPGMTIDVLSQLPRTILAGAYDTVWVEFSSAGIGPFIGTVAFGATPCPVTHVRYLAGTLVDPGPIITPAGVVFGFTSLGDTTYQTITVRNPSSSYLLLDSVRLEPADFVYRSPALPRAIPPHDSLVCTLAFIPLQEGDATGRARAWSSLPCDDSAMVTLSGSSLRKPAIAFQGGVFPPLLCPEPMFSDSVVTLTNTGGEPLTVSRLSITGTNPGDFILQTSAPLTIPASQSVLISIRFQPTGIGLRSALLIVESNAPQSPILNISLTGTKDSAGLQVDAVAIDFGTLHRCEVPVSRSIVLRNTGSIPLTITASGPALPPGLSYDQTRFPRLITAADSFAVEFRFSPTTFGASTGAVRFDADACAIEETVTLGGVYEHHLPVVSPGTIDFGLLGVGQSASRDLRITNPTTTAMRIASVSFEPSPPGVTFSSIPNFPLVLDPAGNIMMTSLYQPSGNDTVATEIIIILEQPCPDTIRVPVIGQSRGAYSVIALPTLQAAIGERISIPLTLVNSANLALTGTRSFTTEIAFNRTILWPERVRSATGTASLFTRVSGDTLIARIMTDQPASPANGEIASLDCIVMLGNDDTTTLRFLSYDWTSGTASVSTTDGFFTATGVCEADGKRFIASPLQVQLFQNAPNPVTSSATGLATTDISYFLPRDMHADLRVYNGIGKEMAQLASGPQRQGLHIVRFAAGSLPGGVYWIVLVTPDGMQTRAMRLLR